MMEKLLVRLPPCQKGKTISERDKAFSALAELIINSTDFSTYDRSLRETVREIEKFFLRELCDPHWWPMIETVYDRLCKTLGVHVDGVIVRGVLQRMSGEPFTSLFNFVFNLYHSWVANRLAGRSDEYFWSNLDLLFIEGDDKMDGMNSISDLEEAADSLGLTMTVEYQGPLKWAKFLGRTHTCVNGIVRSHAEFWRTLSKFHLSPRPPGSADADGLLKAKCLSYLATDYSTPVVGAVAWTALQRVKQATVDKGTEKLFGRRFRLGNLGARDLLNKPFPELDPERARQYAFVNNISSSCVFEAHDICRSGKLPFFALEIMPTDVDILPI
jgi:hypothetical protein